MDSMNPPDGPAAPPRFSVPGDLEPAAPSKWPTVFGIIGIIVASLGLVGVCCILASPVATPFFINMMEQQGNAAQDQIDAMKASVVPLWYAAPAAVVTLALSVLLMTVSIGLLRRREKAVGLAKTWAVLEIIWVLVSTPVSIWMQLQAQARMPAGSPQAMSPMIGLVFGTCVGLVLGVGLPVFALIWLNRAKVKDDVARWSEAREEVI